VRLITQTAVRPERELTFEDERAGQSNRSDIYVAVKRKR
jgi:hypothetical protein